MKGFTLALLTCAALSQAKPDFKDVQDTLNRCANGEIEHCLKVQAKVKGKADNAYCATFEITPENFESHWTPLCTIAPPCKGDFEHLINNHVVYDRAYITGANFEKILEALPESFKDKIGHNGVRRSLMNPEVSGPFACRTWLQLTDNEGKMAYDANIFLYDEVEADNKIVKRCRLYSVLPTVELPEARHGPRGLPSDVWGTRSCSCDTIPRQLDCKPLIKDDPLIATCTANPNDPKCMRIDNGGSSTTPDACFVGGGLSECMTSDKLPRECYQPMKKMPEYYSDLDTQIIVGTAAEVKELLMSGHEFYEFAGMVGFTKDPVDEKHLSPRTKALIPKIAGPVACRNLLKLRGTLGEYALRGASGFYYESAKQVCHFVKFKDDFKAQEKESDITYGEAYCA